MYMCGRGYTSDREGHPSRCAISETDGTLGQAEEKGL